MTCWYEICITQVLATEFTQNLWLSRQAAFHHIILKRGPAMIAKIIIYYSLYRAFINRRTCKPKMIKKKERTGEERDCCLWPRRQFLNHNPLKIFNYTGIVSSLMHSAVTRNVHRLHLRTHPLTCDTKHVW